VRRALPAPIAPRSSAAPHPAPPAPSSRPQISSMMLSPMHFFGGLFLQGGRKSSVQASRNRRFPRAASSRISPVSPTAVHGCMVENGRPSTRKLGFLVRGRRLSTQKLGFRPRGRRPRTRFSSFLPGGRELCPRIPSFVSRRRRPSPRKLGLLSAG
jgi:hypothetical protein